jgi:hypothetical protein
MTTEEHALALVKRAVERLREQWMQDAVASADLTPAGDDARRVAATKCRMTEEIHMSIQMEINR